LKIEDFLTILIIFNVATLTLTLDRVMRHTVMHHSSTSTYISNFIKIVKTFCGQTDGGHPSFCGRWTDGRTDIHFIRSTLQSRPKNVHVLRD